MGQSWSRHPLSTATATSCLAQVAGSGLSCVNTWGPGQELEKPSEPLGAQGATSVGAGKALGRDSGAGMPRSAQCQGSLACGTLLSFSNLSLGASPRTWEGVGMERQDHPQPPLPLSLPAGPRCNAAGTGTRVSLLWAPEGKGLRPRVLHGNEHRSLRGVGKLMLSQGRIRLGAGVRNSLPQPAPQPLPQALRQLVPVPRDGNRLDRSSPTLCHATP